MSKVSLKQAAEVLRKLRMTARFILGSLQDELNAATVPRAGLSLVTAVPWNVHYGANLYRSLTGMY